MAKHVYNNDEVYHLFASGTKDHARNGKDTISFTESGVFYSFQTPVAKRVKTAEGDDIILITSRNYSSRTGQQLSKLRRAIHHLNTIEVDEVQRGGWNRQDDSYVSMLARLADAESLEELRGKALRARQNAPYLAGQVVERMRKANTFATTFGLPMPYDADQMAEADTFLATITTNKAPLLKQEKERRAAREASERAAREAEYIAQRERNATRLNAYHTAQLNRDAILDDWRAGRLSYADIRDALSLPYTLQHLVEDYSAFDVPTMLRLEDDEVATSLGARVPVTHAERLYRLVKRREARNGERVGHYALNEVTETEVIIGCHHILWSEVERFAATMGWEEPPRLDDKGLIDARMAAVTDDINREASV